MHGIGNSHNCTGIHIARNGVGSGIYAHADGDFQCTHRNVALAADTASRSAHDKDNVPPGQQTRGYISGRTDFVAVSWNACGMEKGAINDAVVLLDSGARWDALMLQEGPFTENGSYKIIDGGHSFFNGRCVGSKRSVGIVAINDGSKLVPTSLSVTKNGNAVFLQFVILQAFYNCVQGLVQNWTVFQFFAWTGRLPFFVEDQACGHICAKNTGFYTDVLRLVTVFSYTIDLEVFPRFPFTVFVIGFCYRMWALRSPVVHLFSGKGLLTKNEEKTIRLVFVTLSPSL